MIKVIVKDTLKLTDGYPIEQEITFECKNRMEMDALINVLLNHSKEFDVRYEEDKDV